ncbi:MAG TPA: DUF2730 family protein [Fluviicoccus sp.]|nr:DUF2730 family protein [Fluviicoccus sp.]
MSDEAKIAIQGLQWFCTFCLALFTFITHRSAARASQVQQVSDKVSAVSERVTAVEEQLRHIPDPDLLHNLDGDMKAIKAELRHMRDALTPLAKSLDRINDYLLNNK